MEFPIGREAEGNVLYSHLRDAVGRREGGVIYVSGMPGSGKTHTCRHVLELVRAELNVEVLEANCSQVRRPTEIFELLGRLAGSEGRTLRALEKWVRDSEYAILLLDEIDLLLNRKQDVLYRLFDLPASGLGMCIVAISNTHNLPEKAFNSKIRSRMGANALNFPAYTSAQLACILKSRYRGACGPAFEESSIEFCSRRVSSLNGDARKAFEVAAHAVGEARKAKKSVIDVFDVDRSMKAVFQSIPTLFVRDLSAYQKILLIVASKKGPAHLTDLFHNFKALLGLHSYARISFEAFKGVAGSLEELGALKRRRSSPVMETSFIPEELKIVLKGDPVEGIL